mmetsp:Transcript_18210/g.45945  ORF Transcript_18210/g.45945 Transcript_18210/m.45945 type:complete len:247 (-) Transcript_18210:87-827(-)
MLWCVMLLHASALPLDSLRLVEECVPAADRPLHLVHIDVVAVPHHDGGAFGEEVLRDPLVAKLLGEEDRIRVPQHWVGFIEILAVLDVFLDPRKVGSNDSSPPSVLRALALEVVRDGMLVGKAVALGACVVNGTHPRAGERAVKIGIEVFHEELDEVPIAHKTSDHESRHVVRIEWLVGVHTRLEQPPNCEDITVNHSILELPKVLGQRVAVIIARIPLRELALLKWWVVECPTGDCHAGNGGIGR